MANQDNPSYQTIDSLVIPSPEKVDKKRPWSDDRLGIQDYADNLTEYVTRWSAQRLVMSIHGEWGSGKTFMLRRWHQDLIKKGYIAVYINAWQDDFQDPLVAIIGQLKGQIPSSIDVKDAMSKILKNVGTIVASNLLEKYTSLKISELLESGQDIMKRYEQEREALDKLNAALYQLSQELSGADKSAKPIVFIIDELDRCRPDYSVKMLERIKHLFEPPTKQAEPPENQKEHSPGIRFVLGINQTQLECSIRQLYGNDMDVGDYLRRFIDVEQIMHTASPETYCKHLLEKENGISNIISHKGKNPLPFSIHNWIGYMQFSLRQVEYFLRTLCGAWSAIDPEKRVEEYPDYEYALLFLIILRIKDHDRYQQFKARKITAKELIEYFSQFLPILASGEAKPYEHFKLHEQYQQYHAYLHMQHAIYGLARAQGERTHIESALKSLMSLNRSRISAIIKGGRSNKEKEMKRYLTNMTIKRDWADKFEFQMKKFLADPTIEHDWADGFEFQMELHIAQILATMSRFERDLDYPFRLVDMFKEQQAEPKT